MTIELRVLGIGLLGPGLADWAAGQAVLREPSTWQPATTQVPAPQRLPATERRRAGTGVKASIGVADQALAASGLDAATLGTVFTSSSGDTLNCHLLCETLATPERAVSPTRFTNSVHNAPAGYWHIAAASRAPSTSLAACDASFAAGLLEAAVQCAATRAPVLLVACDGPYPEPLHALRPVADVFALALVLAPLAPDSGAPGRRLTVQIAAAVAPSRCEHAGLERVRQGIPAARALPLLLALAAEAATEVVIEGLQGQALRVAVAAR